MAGPVPPTAGWAWQPEHELRLKRGPRPTLAPLATVSWFWKRARPSLKNARALEFVTDGSGCGVVCVALGCPLIAPGRTPGSVWANATEEPEMIRMPAKIVDGRIFDTTMS